MTRTRIPRLDGSRAKAYRRGATIVELLVLMTLLAFVLGAAIVQLQLLLRLGQDGRSRLDQATVRERLGRQLRRDVHEANAARPFGDTQTSGLELEISRNEPIRIEYRVGKAEIVRTESATGKPVRREVYSFPGLVEARFEELSEADGRLLALRLTKAVGKAKDAPPRVEEILAALGGARSGGDTNSKEAKP